MTAENNRREKTIKRLRGNRQSLRSENRELKQTIQDLEKKIEEKNDLLSKNETPKLEQVRRAEKFTELITCVVCYKEQEESMLILLPEFADTCGHLVCASCWDEWFLAELDRGRDAVCPYCRGDVFRTAELRL